jgi:hypothetical protein
MRRLIAASIAGSRRVRILDQGQAADLPVKPNEPAFTVYDWTEFYVGMESGTGWSSGVIQTDARPPAAAI